MQMGHTWVTEDGPALASSKSYTTISYTAYAISEGFYEYVRLRMLAWGFIARECKELTNLINCDLPSDPNTGSKESDPYTGSKKSPYINNHIFGRTFQKILRFDYFIPCCANEHGCHRGMNCNLWFSTMWHLKHEDSDEPASFNFKLWNSKCFSRLAKALIRLRVCTVRSEPLLVAHTTLL